MEGGLPSQIREYNSDKDIKKVNDQLEKLNKLIVDIQNTDYSLYTHECEITKFNGRSYNQPMTFLFNMKPDGDQKYLDGAFKVFGEGTNEYITGTFVSGKLHGEYKHTLADGSYSISTYKFGKLHGPSKAYYSNNKIQAEATYINGERDGQYKSYHNNGNICITCEYVNGKLDGEYNIYRFSGVLRERRFYKNNKLHGEYKIFYSNGNIKSLTDYENGRLHGRYYTYYSDKTINKSLYYYNDKLVDKEIYMENMGIENDDEIISPIKQEDEKKPQFSISGLDLVTIVDIDQ